MYNKLSEIIKKIKGNVIVIGLDDKLLKEFDSNNKVTLYSIYSGNATKKTKPNKRQTNQGKVINIKKLRKYINKKSVDYMIINMNEIIKYYKYIIKDTIYLNKNKIYIYSDEEIDSNFIVSRYNRYNVKIEVTEYKNGYLYIIDNKNGKTNFFKDIRYLIKDTFYNMAEFIGNILVS